MNADDDKCCYWSLFQTNFLNIIKTHPYYKTFSNFCKKHRTMHYCLVHMDFQQTCLLMKSSNINFPSIKFTKRSVYGTKILYIMQISIFLKSI